MFQKGNTLVVQFSQKSIEPSKKLIKKTIKPVIYPIFEEASTFINNDNFWSKILYDASRGVFPKLYKYSNGVLFYKFKTNKYLNQVICQTDPFLCLTNIQNFMRNNNTHSMQDTKNKIKEMETLMNESPRVDLDWNTIKSKKLKQLILSNYVIYLKNKYLTVVLTFDLYLHYDFVYL